MESTQTAGNDLSDARQRLKQRKRYKRLFYGILGIGIVGYLVLLFVWTRVGGDALAVGAVSVYWGAFLVALGIHYLGPVDIEDERDEQVSNQAAGVTMGIAAFLLIFGGPGSVTLEQTGVYTAPSWFGGMMWGYVLLFAIFAVSHWYIKRRHF